MRYAVVFPGHGMPTPGLVAAWHASDERVLLEEAAGAAGVPVAELLAADRTAPPVTLDVAVFAVSVAAFRRVEQSTAPAPMVLAGHDAGEITAAVAAGAMSLADGAALVAERGRAIHDAAMASPTPGGTLAVHGLADRDEVRLTAALPPDITVAEDNAPGELVLSGPSRQLAAAATQAVSLGGRVEDLGAEGAEHSPAMTPVLVRISAVLRRIQLRPPKLPVLDGADGHQIDAAPDLARSLVEGALAPVHWRGVQQQLHGLQLDAVVEFGPGTLRELATATLPEVTSLHAATPDDVDALTVRLRTS